MLHCSGLLFFGLGLCPNIAPCPFVTPTFIQKAFLAISTCMTFTKKITGGRILSFDPFSTPQREHHVGKEIAESNI
jgi:hypothetical protein